MISSLKLSRGAKKFWIGWSVFVILMLLVVVKGQLFSPVTFPVHFNLQIGIDKLMLAVQSVAVYVIFSLIPTRKALALPTMFFLFVWINHIIQIVPVIFGSRLIVTIIYLIFVISEGAFLYALTAMSLNIIDHVQYNDHGNYVFSWGATVWRTIQKMWPQLLIASGLYVISFAIF